MAASSQRHPRAVTVGLGQGQGENPGWSLLLEFPWSEAVSKANKRDNGGQQKNTKCSIRAAVGCKSVGLYST